mmetsp:Transcript_3460/g.5360  ORF Transcript_3460/g.5360 Transcript_3460/m.5360 type:complete len:83 (+) Transcript_3460:975-1223(+)
MDAGHKGVADQRKHGLMEFLLLVKPGLLTHNMNFCFAVGIPPRLPYGSSQIRLLLLQILYVQQVVLAIRRECQRIQDTHQQI